jgi:hypothetical protein
MNDPFSENHCLAGAGHRENDHGTLAMGDGLCLLRIELNVFHDWTSLNVRFVEKKKARRNERLGWVGVGADWTVGTYSFLW